MSKSDTIGHKIAPIFDLKSNKSTENVFNIKSKQKFKRKMKSKNESKRKIIKKFDNNCLKTVSEDTTDCRRSKRLRDKVTENEVKFSYSEDIEEEMVYDKNDTNFDETVKTNDSFVEFIEENSNTIDYWSDIKTNGRQLHGSDGTDEDIEIIETNNTLKCCLQQSDIISVPIQTPEDIRRCLLWTEKYKPMNCSQIIGHKSAVNSLKSWLENWNSNRDSYRHELDREEDPEEYCLESNSCLLVCGPTGSGKTSLVYAIAEELKYEVLELNASMKRNGRVISKILGEATQSHHMQKNKDSNGSQHSIHLFFNSIAKNVSNETQNEIKVIKNKKKSKAKGILNYFTKSIDNSVKKESKHEFIEIIDKQNETKTESQSNDCTVFSPKALSIATNSLVLFDDIDVLFDEDITGFWSAFNKINSNTKVPVILTATQFIPYIRECVNGLQVLSLNKPNDCQSVSALKHICDKEFEKSEDFSENVCQYLSSTYDNDIRRCINELQFGSDCWQRFQTPEPQTPEPLKDLSDIAVFYDLLLFTDVMENQFNILSASESRELWMNCKPMSLENRTNSTSLATDIIDSMNELNEKINNKLVFTSKQNTFEKPIDCQTIENIYKYLNPNTNLRSVLLDYCPYLSLICESESIRRAQTSSHSRKSRRFLHHLDSIHFYIDDEMKTKLISAFGCDLTLNPTLISKPIVETIDIKDDDFYD